MAASSSDWGVTSNEEPWWAEQCFSSMAPGGGSTCGEGKGGEESSGEGKGGEKSRGGKRGKGKGCKPRTPGTVRFLANHRRMLTHEAERTKIKLEQAESALQQACSDFEQVMTLENSTRLRKAADWVTYRSQNVDIVALKWRGLDEEHVYILTDHGEAVPLTEREK